MYVVFPNTDLGQELRDIFDRRFTTMLDNGEAKALFERWNWPTFPK